MKFWKRINAAGSVTVESYWHDSPIPGAQEIMEAEFNQFVAALPLTPDRPKVFDKDTFLRALQDDATFKEKLKNLLKP